MYTFVLDYGFLLSDLWIKMRNLVGRVEESVLLFI